VRAGAGRLARGLVVLLAGFLLIVGLSIAILETGWGKNQLRALIVRQANEFLTGTLSIGRLGGSLFRGLELSDVKVSRDGTAIVAIDHISLSYDPLELWQNGTLIRRVVVTRPRVQASRETDGGWNLGRLVRRRAQERDRTGPGRPIRIDQLEIIDASITLDSPVKFGPANVPTNFESLNISMSFAYAPVRWTLDFDKASWIGRDPDLTVTHLTGSMGRGADGWFFDSLSVQTPRSAFVFGGQVLVGDRPTALELDVRADRFAFQEWAGVLGGLRNIAVEASFNARLQGPLERLETRLSLSGTGGSVGGQLTLNTRVPGWHGTGAVDVTRIDLARWLNSPERSSDINGRLVFDLDLDLGRRFPRGTYKFDGPHVRYLGYSADDFHSDGRLTAREVLIDHVSGIAYRASILSTSGSIGLDRPYPYRFQGAMRGLDLRFVPDTVPVPHVESTLALTFDVTGRFSMPFISGTATFAPSEFLGASIADGTIGSIDTASQPVRYSGDGAIDGVDLGRFAEGLAVEWLKDPRYAGTVSGRFHVDGSGGDGETLSLNAGGRLDRATLFHGTASDADVSLRIDAGTLESSFSGRLADVNPAIAFGDPRLAASLSGAADVKAVVRDLLVRSPMLADFDIGGRLSLERSTIRDLQVDAATIAAALNDEQLMVSELTVSSAAISGTGSGAVSLNDRHTSDFQYTVSQLDLSQLQAITGQAVAGLVQTTGRLTGPASAPKVSGDGTLANLRAGGISALTVAGEYAATIPSTTGTGSWLTALTAQATTRGEFVEVAGQTFPQTSLDLMLDSSRADFVLKLAQTSGRTGEVSGAAIVGSDRRSLDVLSLDITIGDMPWRLVPADRPPHLAWSEGGISTTPVVFATGHEDDQRIDLDGTWRYDGGGALRVSGRHVFLESFQSAGARPARYGGVADFDAVVQGTRDAPLVTGTFTISNGRVERVTYEKLSGRVDYTRGGFDIDVRLDQGPDTWLTARGRVPRTLLDSDLPEDTIDVAIESSTIDLGLISGVTDVVQESSGRVRLNLHAIGTSGDPHFEGAVDIADASFLVSSTGVRYRNGHVSLGLTSDRITVETFSLEDENGRTLALRGSLGTHELKVGDVAIDVTADRFEVLRNEFGRLDINAMLTIRGEFESPRVAGSLTINGDSLDVNAILNRVLFRPYATEPVALTTLDAVAALNPWSRLGVDVELRVPRTLRLVGTDVQVSTGTPIGLGDINLRVGGDLYLYKDPGQPLYIMGSLDQMAGTYAFQGRRFEIDETASSINFVGDLDPQIWVTVTREISGVETRVTLSGSLRQPELRLASTPPLEESDVLSLIVFNSTPNGLSAVQQQELAVRAATLAAGFVAQPLLQAVQNELGLEVFEIEASTEGSGAPIVTIGEEIAPGLVARFSRQFGQDPWNQATVEYYLSRLFRLRATFSDADSISARSPFRRVERAGIDLLLFFSF
jgi:translocation-and-assembly-module (TAM) inner membrane subunit TamB-like protein